MSDNDSIISEDIKYSSDDGSDSYDAADDDFEFDEVAKLPVQKFYDLPSPKLGQKQAGYEIKEIVKKISSSISRIHSVSDNGYNDYSADFDDTIAQSNESLLYSNNFEADGLKTILDSSGNHAVISEIRCNSVANLPITTQQNTLRFPGVNLVSLHAEIALEEISKEVVRLRNQQRNLLQERRQIAREKKSRADSRRTQYQIEIRDMRQKLIKSEDGYQSQARQILQIQDSLESVISSKKNIVLDLEMKEEELRDVKERVLELQEKLVKSIASLTTEKCESRAKEVNWISERENFRAAVLRANMLAAVVQQSVEANEKR